MTINIRGHVLSPLFPAAHPPYFPYLLLYFTFGSYQIPSYVALCCHLSPPNLLWNPLLPQPLHMPSNLPAPRSIYYLQVLAPPPHSHIHLFILSIFPPLFQSRRMIWPKMSTVQFLPQMLPYPLSFSCSLFVLDSRIYCLLCLCVLWFALLSI